MINKSFQQDLHQFTQNFPSSSLVNADGILLSSSDLGSEFLTTTRLVSFQIIKKYLNPKANDLFIMNDPENGGFNLSKLIYVAGIDTNLYLIWDQECPLINFKIPPTPLYENNNKNEFVWKALVEDNTNSVELKKRFEDEKKKIDSLKTQKKIIQSLSLVKNQNAWLKSTQEIFESQFANKALGSTESIYKTKSNQILKLKFSAEEKQNIKSITFDFTNTSMATDYHTASHVVESGIISRVIQFYQIENYFSQAVLDKIKIILPPKSIVSKSHANGSYNYEIQSICNQMCSHNLTQLNTQTRKISTAFELNSELSLNLIFSHKSYPMVLDSKSFNLFSFEELIKDKQVEILKMQKKDRQYFLSFKFLNSQAQKMIIRSCLGDKNFSLKLNDLNLLLGEYPVKPTDTFHLEWNS